MIDDQACEQYIHRRGGFLLDSASLPLSVPVFLRASQSELGLHFAADLCVLGTVSWFVLAPGGDHIFF